MKNSPDIDIEKPLSYQQLDLLHTYYDWPGYFSGEMLPAVPLFTLPPKAVNEKDYSMLSEIEDLHLCSAKDWIGYRMDTIDGETGHVEGFLFDDVKWHIHYLVVNTRSWLPRRKVLIAPKSIRTINWSEQKIYADLTKESIIRSLPFDPEN